MSQIVWDKKTLHVRNKIDDLIKDYPGVKNISVGKVMFEQLLKKIPKASPGYIFKHLSYKDVEIKP